MTAVHLHLLVVHLPVILCPLALALLGLDAARRIERPLTGYLLLVVAAAFGIVAFYSGPSAYESLQDLLAAEKPRVEDHAVIARAAFVVVVLSGVLALQTLLQYLQGEVPAKVLRWAVVLTALGASYLLAWSAHLGGQIRHPEIREGEAWIFPRLPD